MAEIEEIGEIIGEVEDGIEGETAAEEATAEEAEEMVTEVKEATESVGVLSRSVDALKKLDLPQALRKFAKFVATNAAIGGILYGVNVVLKKMFGGSGGDANKQKIQQKQKKVKALAQLTSDLSSALNKLAKWTKDKQDVTVDVDEGITVPLPDFLSKFTKPMEKDVESAFSVAKQLMKKDGGAKPTFVVPTTEQVDQLINSSESIAHTLQKIITFVNAKKGKYPDLGTLPVEKDDVDKINDDLAAIKKLPYA